MKCKYPGFFWPASRRRRYVAHCQDCRNFFSGRCAVEIDKEEEMGQLLLNLTGAKEIRQAIGRIQRQLTFELWSFQPDHWLVKWDEREFEKWRKENHRKFLKSLTPEEKLLYQSLSPKEKLKYEMEKCV